MVKNIISFDSEGGYLPPSFFIIYSLGKLIINYIDNIITKSKILGV